MIEKELINDKILSDFVSAESKKLKFCSRCHLIYLFREELKPTFLSVCPVCGEALDNHVSCSHYISQRVSKRKYKRNLLW